MSLRCRYIVTLNQQISFNCFFSPAEIVNGCLLIEEMETTGEQVSNQRHLARQIQSPAECALACNHLEECATFMFFPTRYCELRTSGKLIFSPHNYTSGWCPKGRKANLLNFERGEKILVKIFYKKVVETTQQIPINSSASKIEVPDLSKYLIFYSFKLSLNMCRLYKIKQ